MASAELFIDQYSRDSANVIRMIIDRLPMIGKRMRFTPNLVNTKKDKSHATLPILNIDGYKYEGLAEISTFIEENSQPPPKRRTVEDFQREVMSQGEKNEEEGIGEGDMKDINTRVDEMMSMRKKRDTRPQRPGRWAHLQKPQGGGGDGGNDDDNEQMNVRDAQRAIQTGQMPHQNHPQPTQAAPRATNMRPPGMRPGAPRNNRPPPATPTASGLTAEPVNGAAAAPIMGNTKNLSPEEKMLAARLGAKPTRTAATRLPDNIRKAGAGDADAFMQRKMMQNLTAGGGGINHD